MRNLDLPATRADGTAPKSRMLREKHTRSGELRRQHAPAQPRRLLSTTCCLSFFSSFTRSRTHPPTQSLLSRATARPPRPVMASATPTSGGGEGAPTPPPPPPSLFDRLFGRRSALAGAAAAAAGVGGAATPGRAAAAAASGPKGPLPANDAEWKAALTPEAYRVLRKAGTERPGTSPLDKEKRAGAFTCAGCGSSLFDASAKFNSGTGWPSFFQPLPGAVEEDVDRSIPFMTRTEVHCAVCKGHLGHVFPDGPRPTGLRYCMNGVALGFEPKAA